MNEHQIKRLQQAYESLADALGSASEVGHDELTGDKIPIFDHDAELFEAVCLDMNRAKRGLERILKRKDAMPACLSNEPLDLWK